jgi:hypothetical protein
MVIVTSADRAEAAVSATRAPRSAAACAAAGERFHTVSW